MIFQCFLHIWSYFDNKNNNNNTKTNQIKNPKLCIYFEEEKTKQFGSINSYCCMPGIILRSLHIAAHFLFPTILCSKHFPSLILRCGNGSREEPLWVAPESSHFPNYYPDCPCKKQASYSRFQLMRGRLPKPWWFNL